MRNLIILVLLLCLPLTGAVEFDAVDDELDCGSTNALDDLCADNNPCSIVGWIKPDTPGEGNSGKITFNGSFGDTSLIGFGIRGASPNQTLELEVKYSTATFIRRSALGSIDLTGVWQHVAVTHDGSQTAANATLYLDGVEPSYSMTTDGSGTRNSSAGEPFHIGNSFNSGATFDGEICCVAVFDYALTQHDIDLLSGSMQMNLASQSFSGGAPLAHWRLFDRSEGTALSGTGIVLDETGTFDCTPAANPTARAMPFGVQ